MLADSRGAADRPQHHRVGFGSIAEYPGPFPGYTAARPRSCAPLPRILQENGYVTGGFGKWHLTPDNVQGAAGPFDHWPQSWGFDHYWGFLSGAAGQYDPIITNDNTTVGVQPGKDGKPYYFPDDLTDNAVEWLHAARAGRAEAVAHVLLDRLRPRAASCRQAVGRSSTSARWRSTPATRRMPNGTSADCSTRSRRWATLRTR
ncbi:MAG: sulfatase-like hydrolase/transferase [Solirubrobacteraceae bacterium]